MIIFHHLNMELIDQCVYYRGFYLDSNPERIPISEWIEKQSKSHRIDLKINMIDVVLDGDITYIMTIPTYELVLWIVNLTWAQIPKSELISADISSPFTHKIGNYLLYKKDDNRIIAQISDLSATIILESLKGRSVILTLHDKKYSCYCEYGECDTCSLPIGNHLLPKMTKSARKLN